MIKIFDYSSGQKCNFFARKVYVNGEFILCCSLTFWVTLGSRKQILQNAGSNDQQHQSTKVYIKREKFIRQITSVYRQRLLTHSLSLYVRKCSIRMMINTATITQPNRRRRLAAKPRPSQRSALSWITLIMRTATANRLTFVSCDGVVFLLNSLKYKKMNYRVTNKLTPYL